MNIHGDDSLMAQGTSNSVHGCHAFLRCQTGRGQNSAQAFGFSFLRHLQLFAPKTL
jgi:hypothetical protein